MQWAYETYGESVYSNLGEYEKDILDWCEKNEINLSAANKKKLLKLDTWRKHQNLVQQATVLMQSVGSDIYNDFNQFKDFVEAQLKASKTKLSATEKKAILNVVSWYDVDAEKVIKSKSKLSCEKLEKLLDHLNCTAKELSDFGFYATGKKDEYIQYETESDLRDSENVPLKDEIHAYFLKEVKPHVEEAWINLESTKIGCEISFNKYFYRHKSLRDIDVVAQDILALEKENEGLIMDILKLA